MRFRLVLIAAAVAWMAPAALAQSPKPSIPSSPPPLPSPTGLASLEERIANAKSAKVTTNILGVSPGDELDRAHRRLDKLCDKKHPPKSEEGDENEKEAENKVLWQLSGTNYSAIFVKADQKERITYVVGLLRPGKEIGFEKIGEVKKAAVQTDNLVAWDVIRPDHPHLRVVAKGKARKADTLTIFVVERPRQRSGN